MGSDPISANLFVDLTTLLCYCLYMRLAVNKEYIREDWNVLLSVFPPGWEELAQKTGALKGLRKNKSAENLLRTLLLHIACGYSLRETAARAKETGIAELSDVALLKRLRKSSKWLQELANCMLLEDNPSLLPKSDIQMRVFDASVIHEPGKTGSQWRLHYGLRLPSLECDYFELTPTNGSGNGEALYRFPITAGEYVIADRGYCSIAGIHYVAMEKKAHVLVRYSSVMPLTDLNGSPFALLDHLSLLDQTGTTGFWPVTIRNDQGSKVHGRICAIRKSATAIAESQKRVRDRATRRQQQVKPETLILAKYVVVFTNFPEEQFTAEDVLNWYRVRWQIELVFKRFKSIAQIGHLPKHDQESSKAWLYGKLFLALTTERVIRLASDFSPLGYLLPIREETQSLA